MRRGWPPCDSLTSACTSTRNGRVPSRDTITTLPDTGCSCCARKIADGLLTGFRPWSVIAKMPSSLTAPKRFFTARMTRNRVEVSPSKYRTVSTMCSSTRGPASWPSLVTCPTRKMATFDCLAKRTSMAVLSRIWLTEPGADCRLSLKMVWIESMTITAGFKPLACATISSTRVVLNNCSRSLGKPSRWARMLICCGDSSPVT